MGLKEDVEEIEREHGISVYSMDAIWDQEGRESLILLRSGIFEIARALGAEVRIERATDISEAVFTHGEALYSQVNGIGAQTDGKGADEVWKA